MNKFFWPLVILSFGVASLACAQPDQAKASAQAHTAKVSSASTNKTEGLIKLDVLVLDNHGRPVAGLKQSDFSLFEKGYQQKILSFQEVSAQGKGSEPPVKVILLIDTVHLPRPMAEIERSAVESYLRQRNGQLAHSVSVYLLDRSGLWRVAPSSDGDVLASEIADHKATMVRRAGRIAVLGAQKAEGSVGLPESPVLTVMKALGQIATYERTQPGRKLLVWVGPGWGMGSANYNPLPAADARSTFYLVCWFSTLLREAHLALYNFNVGAVMAESTVPDYRVFLKGVTSPKQASGENVSRDVLAVQSGGAVMSTMDLVAEIERCVQQAGPFYRISFNPLRAEHPDAYHALTVVMNRPGLTAHTSTGYYDQPYYSPEPVYPRRPISVQQLEQLLKSSRGESDAKIAERISAVKLTERLSGRRLSQMEAGERGKRTRREVEILADASAFLDPPAEEIPAAAPLSPAAQQHLLSLTSEYLAKKIRRLPNFFARETLLRYQDTTKIQYHGVTTSLKQFGMGGSWTDFGTGMSGAHLFGMPIMGERPNSGDGTIQQIHYEPLHFAGKSTTTVYYRDGEEITDTKARERNPDMSGFTTYGVFGPVLGAVFDAIDKSGGLTWSHWEQSATGRVAVFRYVVPTDKSPYEVQLCCVAGGDGNQAFKQVVGYHGELAIDPESGAVMRLEFKADLTTKAWVARSEVMVRYGQVEIGGKSYICPLRSVSIMRVRFVQILGEWDESFRTYGPYTTMLDDVRFDRYHLFGGTVQMLPGFTPVK